MSAAAGANRRVGWRGDLRRQKVGGEGRTDFTAVCGLDQQAKMRPHGSRSARSGTWCRPCGGFDRSPARINCNLSLPYVREATKIWGMSSNPILRWECPPQEKKGKSNMMRRTLALAALPALLYVNQPAAFAGTIYTYTGPTFGPFDIDITLNLPFTGAGLDNIPPGTDVSADLTSFTSTVPPEDEAGFLVGPAPDYQLVESPPTLAEIGTDALGNITSWDIEGTLFASYPAAAGENPNDFFCTWSIATKNTGDTATSPPTTTMDFVRHRNDLVLNRRNLVTPGTERPGAGERDVARSGLLGLVAWGVRGFRIILRA